jgi:HAD superfamily hydrolase (TIGR01509 family)
LGRSIPDNLGRRYGALLLERPRRDLKPIPGVKAAIMALRCSRCVASSSSPERIRLSLEVTGLASLFFSATQVARGKPAPDFYLFAAGAMRVAPDCVVVENSVLGATAGRAAGMTVIGFSGGHTPPRLMPRGILQRQPHSSSPQWLNCRGRWSG